jgi:hypothetical protein
MPSDPCCSVATFPFAIMLYPSGHNFLFTVYKDGSDVSCSVMASGCGRILIFYPLWYTAPHASQLVQEDCFLFFSLNGVELDVWCIQTKQRKSCIRREMRRDGAFISIRCGSKWVCSTTERRSGYTRRISKVERARLQGYQATLPAHSALGDPTRCTVSPTLSLRLPKKFLAPSRKPSIWKLAPMSFELIPLAR